MNWIQSLSLVCASAALLGAQSPDQNAANQTAPVQSGRTPIAPIPAAQSPKKAAAQVPELAFSDRFALNLPDGLAKIEELTLQEDYEGAKQAGIALLAMRSFDAWRGALDLADDSWWNPVIDKVEPLAEYFKLSFSRTEKAHLQYTLGVVALAEEDAKTAKRKFETTTAKAGPGTLRAAASYNISTLALFSGEAWRAQMPEFGGQPPAPGPVAPPAPGAPPADPKEPPDPLEEARAAYLAAKAGYIQRLRLDWNDADTRANMELVMRRLRELDEIERQREEEEQEEQNDENEDEESEDSESEKDDKEKQDPSEDQSESDPSDDQENSDQDEEQQPENPEPEEPSEEDQEQDPSEEEQEGEDQQEAEEQPSEPQQEVFLTKEEVQRLLDRLKEHEEQGQELRERKRRAKRPTARDW
jgi:hypothetical protein